MVDLTDDTPEETKTSAIDATKKALLKKLLMAKMAEGDSSSSSSDSDSGSDDDEADTDDDLILVDELKPSKPKRTFKRRNGNVTQNDDDYETGTLNQQLPQSKDAMLTSDLMNKLFSLNLQHPC